MNKNRTFIAISSALLLGVLGAASAAQAATHQTNPNGWNAYGYAAERGQDGGQFQNGDFIPHGTSQAQVPSHHQEDNYGSEAGRD